MMNLLFNPKKNMKTKRSNFIDQLIENGEITINPELDKDDGVIHFPEKVKRGKEVLAKGNLPKAYYEQMAKKSQENKK